MTSASLVVDAKIDSNDQNITVDLTPKFSYTGQASDRLSVRLIKD